jgi:hypothetical protein
MTGALKAAPICRKRSICVWLEAVAVKSGGRSGPPPTATHPAYLVRDSGQLQGLADQVNRAPGDRERCTGEEVWVRLMRL